MEHYESEKSQSNTNSVKKSVDAMKSAGFTKEQLENKQSNRTPSYVTKASKK
jgi:hypothetical protein